MKQMKRRAWMPLVALLMCLMFVVSGCSGKKEEKKKEEKKESEYADLAGVYRSDLSVEGGMSVELYLQISKEGKFIFSRSTDFSKKEKGAGYLAKNKEKKDTFVYEVLGEEKFEKEEKVAEFEVTKEGGIEFKSIMWFGATTPRFVADDGTETYPIFLPYEEEKEGAEEEATEEEAAEESAEETTTETTEETTVEVVEEIVTEEVYYDESYTEPQVNTSNFREGTYYGSFGKYVDAMQSDIHYDISLSCYGGSYTYNVSITVSGNLSYTGSESYNGSYTVDGNYLNMTGTLSSASAGAGGDLTITGVLSSFAGGSESVTLY